jgi:hypothetical protein
MYCTAVKRMGDTFSSRPNIFIQAEGAGGHTAALVPTAGKLSFREVVFIVTRGLGGKEYGVR